MGDLPIEDIANRIATSILQLPHLSKDKLIGVITPNLKIWLKTTDAFKTGRATKPKLQETVELRGLQERFWKSKVKQVKTEEEMKILYKELSDLMVAEGYKP